MKFNRLIALALAAAFLGGPIGGALAQGTGGAGAGGVGMGGESHESIIDGNLFSV
jgi:hypothetical protein